MSDFDTVLERLLSEPAFAAALATDPGAALAGYQLGPDEVELLRSQVSTDTGGGLTAVETRTNKSSTFGLFSAVLDVGHSLSAGDGALGPVAAAGSGAGTAAQHVVGATQGFGDAPGGAGAGHEGWVPTARSGFGAAPAQDASTGFGSAPTSPLENVGQAFGQAEHIMPPQGYHPHIDANGDGHWDRATFIGTKNDGVEIFVDVDHDGHPDFVGHDTNSDGLVDYADYDKNDDGIFEKRMYDDNRDGWLDRTVPNTDK